MDLDGCRWCRFSLGFRSDTCALKSLHSSFPICYMPKSLTYCMTTPRSGKKSAQLGSMETKSSRKFVTSSLWYINMKESGAFLHRVVLPSYQRHKISRTWIRPSSHP